MTSDFAETWGANEVEDGAIEASSVFEKVADVPSPHMYTVGDP